MILNNKPKIIKGGHHFDDRGSIAFINDFLLDDYKRFYITINKDIRAWQGHQFESKAFYCLEGEFTIALIKIDDWENPSKNLEPVIFKLSNTNELLLIPSGYASGIKSVATDSKLLIFSDKTLEESVKDDYRYDKNLWIEWDKIK